MIDPYLVRSVCVNSGDDHRNDRVGRNGLTGCGVGVYCKKKYKFIKSICKNYTQID